MNRTRVVLARSSLLGGLIAWGVLAPFVARAQKVDIQFDQEADFSRIHRYQWRTHPVFEKQPQLQELYSTGIQLVMQAGNAQLMKRGFHPDDASPDVFITFYILARNAERTTTHYDPGWGYGWYSSAAWAVTETEPYIAGMLVIDIVDAGTSKLLWRAHCGAEIKDMSKRDKKITAAVNKALDRFPPKGK